MAERMKLTVTQVSEPVAVGDKGAEKLQFRAKGSDGKELPYFTFSKRLFNAIQNDKEIEADVEVTTREVGDVTYTDRKVVEIYIGGKPIASKTSPGRSWGGKSPEEIASIEAQVAVKTVAELWAHGTLVDDSPEVVGMRSWLRRQFRVKEAWPKGAAPLAPPKEEEALDKPLDSDVKGSEEPPKPALERFKDECLRVGWNPKTKKGADEIHAWLQQSFGMKWNQLSEEAQERAVEQMRKLADEKEQE